MSSLSLPAIFSFAMLGLAAIKMYQSSQASFGLAAGIRNRGVRRPTGVDEPSNNLFDPMNTRSHFDAHNPVEFMDVGPFGVPRTIRETSPSSGYYYDSYGDVLQDY